MRSRIAITLMLVLGFGFSSAGVGMAVQGVSSQDVSAAQDEYGKSNVQPLVPAQDQNEVQNETEEGTNPTGGDGGGNEVAGQDEQGAADNGGQVAGEQVAENRQLAVEAGSDELPFTGFAAIPVLLMGFALLTAGFMLRRRA